MGRRIKMKIVYTRRNNSQQRSTTREKIYEKGAIKDKNFKKIY
jgi:hypothetical protein